MEAKNQHVLIVGAGLSGSLLALRMAQRGFQVSLLESRPDLRTTDISAGRSINLALSSRGFQALESAGLGEEVREICIPMGGRMMHDKFGATFESAYSGRDNEYINSISRGQLNGVLLDAAESHPNVKITFEARCLEIDIKNNRARFDKDGEFTVEADVIFGADGAGSVLRKSYFNQSGFLFSLNQNYLDHGYKELEIPANSDGSHQLSKDHLHIWPRGNFMLIALPNLDGSFTVTLFLSYADFEKLNSKETINAFFEEHFPDALALIPNILEEFENNPTGPLGTIKCHPWSFQGKNLILGDAAHAIVPFYGQGMNASFEDVYVFNTVLDENLGSWKAVFEKYQAVRKADTDAIADLAIDNYYEMRDHVADPVFKQKREVELLLEKECSKEYFSKYSMVTFKPDMGYDLAMRKGRAQDKAIVQLLKEKKISLNSMDAHEILEMVNHKTNELL